MLWDYGEIWACVKVELDSNICHVSHTKSSLIKVLIFATSKYSHFEAQNYEISSLWYGFYSCGFKIITCLRQTLVYVLLFLWWLEFGLLDSWHCIYMLSYPYEHASSLIALNHYWISLSLIEVLDLTLSFFL